MTREYIESLIVAIYRLTYPRDGLCLHSSHGGIFGVIRSVCTI